MVCLLCHRKHWLLVLFCLSYSSSGRAEGFPFFSEAHHVLRLAEGLWFNGTGLPFHWGDKSQAALQCCSVRALNTIAIQLLLPCAFFPSPIAAVFLLLCFVFLSSSVSCPTITGTGPQAKAVVFPTSAMAGGSGQSHKGPVSAAVHPWLWVMNKPRGFRVLALHRCQREQ